MSDYLGSNYDTDCKTVWSEVLKCTIEDSWGFFYKDFHRSDVIYEHATSYVMSLETYNVKCFHLVQKYIGFPVKIVIIIILTVYPYSCSWQLILWVCWCMLMFILKDKNKKIKNTYKIPKKNNQKYQKIPKKTIPINPLHFVIKITTNK